MHFINFFLRFSVEEAGGKALPCVLDVRDEQQVKSVVKTAVEKVLWKKNLALSSLHINSNNDFVSLHL